MGKRGRDEKRLLAALRRPRAGTARQRRDEPGASEAGAEEWAQEWAEDRAAAEALVEATWRQTYAALFRLTGGDADLAADLTQDAYRKAWAALASFDGRARFATWLYRIAYTTFLNHARRPHLVVPLEERGTTGATGPADADLPPPDRDGGHADASPLPDEALAERRSRERLRRAVLALPEELRYTVTARYWGDHSAAEIGRQEGITATAVRKRLRKANTLLAARLESEDVPTETES